MNLPKNIYRLIKKKKSFYILLFVVVIAIYFKAIFFKFTYLDDASLINNRASFLDSFANIFKSFSEPVFYLAVKDSFYYRPILNVFFILQYKLFTNYYFGYHLFNILVHYVNTILLYKLLVALNTKRRIAFISTLIFAVHPVLTQAVAWIPGLNDLLFAMFFLASFIYLIYYLESGIFKNLFFFLLFFGLSIFTKESALTTIFIFIVAYFAIKHGRSFKKFTSIFIPSFILIATFFFVRSRVVSFQPPSLYLLKSVFSNSGGAFLVNFGKLFFPFNLSVMPILYQNNYLWGILAVLLTVLAFFMSKKKKITLLLLGSVIFLTTFAPVLINVMPGEKLVMYEHRMYVPLIGVIIAFLGVSAYSKYLIDKKVFIPILIAFSVITFVHMNKFRDQYVFWESTQKISEIFPFAKTNMAIVYYQQGKNEQAKKLLLELATLDKFKDSALNTLGIIYMNEGKTEEAINAYKEALKHNPLNSSCYLNLGYIYKSENDIENAKKYFLYAVYTDNDNTDAMMSLASIYLDEGNVERAQLIYDEVKKHGVEY